MNLKEIKSKGWQGIQCTFSPVPKFNKELKVQQFIKEFSAGIPTVLWGPNNVQKADEMHSLPRFFGVSPAIANALVGGSCYLVVVQSSNFIPVILLK